MREWFEGTTLIIKLRFHDSATAALRSTLEDEVLSRSPSKRQQQTQQFSFKAVGQHVVTADVYRVPYKDPRELEPLPSELQPMILLNEAEAPPSSTLYRLTNVMSRLDSMSNVLVWSTTLPRASTDECRISLIELPLLVLRLAFPCSVALLRI